MLRTMHRASHTSIFITSPVLLLRFHPPLHHKLVTQLSFVNAFVWQDQCELMVSLLRPVPVIYSFLFTTLSSLKCVIYLSSQKNLVISLRLHLKIYFSFFILNILLFLQICHLSRLIEIFKIQLNPITIISMEIVLRENWCVVSHFSHYLPQF